VLKKSLKVATAFGLLLVGYAGYVQVFATVAARFRLAHQGLERGFLRSDSRTKREAIAWARVAFGDRHWTTDEDLGFRFYNVERGYYMFARSYQREKDGKILVFAPFALIWRSRDGKKLQTATSDRAEITLDQPLGVAVKPGTPMRVVRARIEGDVLLRDDKGTPRNPADDLIIGPLTDIAYDEAKLLVDTDSDVLIRDRDMRATAIGMSLDLRPKDEGAAPGRPGGFDGVKDLILKKNVHIVIQDSGRSGVFPGNGKPAKAPASRSPVDLRCDGEMRVELPKPKAPVRVGPPAPPAPTIAEFSRLVRVVQGRPGGAAPDQMDCDHLRLTLLPTPKGPPTPKPDKGGGDAKEGNGEETPDTGGPLTELTIKRADATGHAVWLQSPSQESIALCNQLIYKKLLPQAPDEVYLLADSTSRVRVQKVERAAEGPERGKIQTVTQIDTVDATVFDYGPGSGNSTILARGPGKLETRPALDKPVERQAFWQDQLVLLTEPGPDKQPRKRVTLTGRPRFVDHAQATLDARRSIDVGLKPKGGPKPGADGRAGSGSDAYEVEWLEAREDVHLKTPSETLIARNVLVAQFLPPPANAAVGAGPAAAAPPPSAGQEPAAAPAGPTQDATKPAKPRSDAKADRVNAWIVQRPGQGPGTTRGASTGQPAGGGEVKEVRLRGSVVFHQDPEPGKEEGTDASGEALDLYGLGAGRWKVDIMDRDPRVPLRTSDKAVALLPPAKVRSDGQLITGPRIGLDQSTDNAWVRGPGTLTLLTDRGLLTDKPTEGEPAAAAPRPTALVRVKAKQKPKKAEKVPLTISWKTEMKFFGRAKDPEGRTTAVAEFFDGVRAEMEDALLACQDSMRVYMDRTVTFTRPKRSPGDAEAAGPEPRPEIALIECYRNVTAISRKVDPQTRTLLQQQRIEASDLLTYEKASGDFDVLGPGEVFLINREGEGGPALPNAGGPATGPARTVRPTANPVRGADGARVQASRDPARPKSRTGPPPLTLTQIRFSKQMKGRFLIGKENDAAEPRWSDFFGDVETIHGPLPDLQGPRGKGPDLSYRHNPDRLRPVDSFMTAQTMRVTSEPPPPGLPPDAPARNFVNAWEQVHVLRDDASLEADKVTYDSAKDLYFAYGEGGRPVSVVQQAGPGQLPSTTRGSVVRYNHKTGEAEAINPDRIQLIDKKGTRPVPPPPPSPAKPKTYRNVRPPGRTNLERRGFNGR
jgi:hypothetical protein